MTTGYLPLLVDFVVIQFVNGRHFLVEVIGRYLLHRLPAMSYEKEKNGGNNVHIRQSIIRDVIMYLCATTRPTVGYKDRYVTSP